MNERTCYLAGPIAGLTSDQAVEWRDIATNRLMLYNIEALSPMRFKLDLLPAGVPLTEYYNGTGDEDYSPLITPKGVVARDIWDVQRCDGMLVNLLGARKISIGTVLEIGVAYASPIHKPVVLCIEPALNPHCHIMLMEMCGFVVDSLDEGLDLMGRILGH